MVFNLVVLFEMSSRAGLRRLLLMQSAAEEPGGVLPAWWPRSPACFPPRKAPGPPQVCGGEMAAFPLSAVSGEGLREEASHYLVTEKDGDPRDVSHSWTGTRPPAADRDVAPIVASIRARLPSDVTVLGSQKPHAGTSGQGSMCVCACILCAFVVMTGREVPGAIV